MSRELPGSGPDLRAHMLSLEPATVRPRPTRELPRVWGFVMDMTFPRGTASIVSLADGTRSLYTSTGGGVIGGGFHEPVAAASNRLLSILESHLDHLEADARTQPPAAAGQAAAVAHVAAHELGAAA